MALPSIHELVCLDMNVTDNSSIPPLRLGRLEGEETRMMTAIVLWFGLQVPLAIVVGKFLKASSEPPCAMVHPVATPNTAAPSDALSISA